jgi:hypothetical protein
VTEKFRIEETVKLRQLREETIDEIVYPPGMTNDERRFIHNECAKLGLYSKSRGKKGSESRYLTVTKKKVRDGPVNEEELPPPMELHPTPQISQGKQRRSRGGFDQTDVLIVVLQQYFTQYPVEVQEYERLATNEVVNRVENVAASKRGADTHSLSRSRKHGNISQRHQMAAQKRNSSKDFASKMAGRRKLPAWEFNETVAKLSRENQVVIVSGETGCGKSTQAPQFILDDAVMGPNSNIVCTQPRRLAAITLAERVASERCESAGSQVGVQYTHFPHYTLYKWVQRTVYSLYSLYTLYRWGTACGLSPKHRPIHSSCSALLVCCCGISCLIQRRSNSLTSYWTRCTSATSSATS